MEKTLEEIESKGFKVVDKDFERPWGGFLVIDESQAQNFSNSFFFIESGYDNKNIFHFKPFL